MQMYDLCTCACACASCTCTTTYMNMNMTCKMHMPHARHMHATCTPHAHTYTACVVVCACTLYGHACACDVSCTASGTYGMYGVMIGVRVRHWRCAFMEYGRCKSPPLTLPICHIASSSERQPNIALSRDIHGVVACVRLGRIRERVSLVATHTIRLDRQLRGQLPRL